MKLKPANFGGHDAFEYEWSGQSGEIKFHYRVVYLSVGDNYATLECWTDPDHWAAAQKLFDALANNVK